MKTVDVGAILDDGQFGGYQKLLVFATAMTIILDGFDNQVMGGAIPVLMREWHKTRGRLRLRPDRRHGRDDGRRRHRRHARRQVRPPQSRCSAASSPSASSRSASRSRTTSTTLIVLRFLAGLGLGGAMPTATAISSEYVPRAEASGRRHVDRHLRAARRRVCRLDRRLHPAALRLARAVRRRRRAAAACSRRFSSRCCRSRRAIWRACRSDGASCARCCASSATTWTHDAVVRRLAREGRPRRRRSASCSCRNSARTRSRCSRCFLFCFFGAYMGTNWVPSMLDRAKFDVGTASYGLLAWNLGVLVFALIAAFVIPRIGSRVTMLVLAAGSVAGCATLAMMNITPSRSRARVHHARRHRRPRQRHADDDVCAGGERLSDVDSRDRRRHDRRVRPHRRRAEPDHRRARPRPRHAAVLLRDCGHDDGHVHARSPPVKRHVPRPVFGTKATIANASAH